MSELSRVEQAKKLREAFPHLFNENRPWAIGTGMSLMTFKPKGVSRSVVRSVAYRRTHSKLYLESIVAGRRRIDCRQRLTESPTQSEIDQATLALKELEEAKSKRKRGE